MVVHVSMHVVTGALQPGSAGISDEQVADSAPMVRALVVTRLELLWRACEPHILPEDERKPDPRFIEAGIRVVDRLTLLYGLTKPTTGGEDQVPPGDPAVRDRAEAALVELEARVRSAGG
jgi:hypothetical protein